MPEGYTEVVVLECNYYEWEGKFEGPVRYAMSSSWACGGGQDKRCHKCIKYAPGSMICLPRDYEAIRLSREVLTAYENPTKSKEIG